MNILGRELGITGSVFNFVQDGDRLRNFLVAGYIGIDKNINDFNTIGQLFDAVHDAAEGLSPGCSPLRYQTQQQHRELTNPFNTVNPRDNVESFLRTRGWMQRQLPQGKQGK